MIAVALEQVREHVWQYIHGLKALARHLMAKHLMARRTLWWHVQERSMVGRLNHPINDVLFVCKGNICRSPLAASYFRLKSDQRGLKVVVRSAGLETTPGKPAHQYARLVAQQHGMPLETHATSLLGTGWIEETDLVVVMEMAQKDRVLSLYPSAQGKVVLLGSLSRECPIEIDDPYSGTMEDFQVCFGYIRRGCDELLKCIDQGRRASSTS